MILNSYWSLTLVLLFLNSDHAIIYNLSFSVSSFKIQDLWSFSSTLSYTSTILFDLPLSGSPHLKLFLLGKHTQVFLHFEMALLFLVLAMGKKFLKIFTFLAEKFILYFSVFYLIKSPSDIYNSSVFIPIKKNL